MTQPIGGYRYVSPGFTANDHYDKGDPLDRPVRQAALDYCEHASTVASGFWCGENDVIVKACSAGKTETDRTLCDDKQMKAAQDGLWSAMKETLKTIVTILIGRVGK